jgi:flagellar FliJ protein
MGKFKFRLQTLLRLREATRDERRAALGQAYQAAEILEQQKKELEGELGRLMVESRAACGPGPLDVDRLLDARRFELSLRAGLDQLRRQQAAVAAEIERRREALVEANREVRVLELLRDKQILKHRQEEESRALKVLDETAQRRSGEEVEL